MTPKRDYGAEAVTSEARRRFHATWRDALDRKDWRTAARCVRIADKRMQRQQRRRIKTIVAGYLKQTH